MPGGAGTAVGGVVVDAAGHHREVAVVGRVAGCGGVHLQDLWRADHVAHVNVVPVGELPQDIAVAKCRRVGHVERIHALATATAATHQHAAPIRRGGIRCGGAEVGLGGYWRAVDIAAVGVGRRGQRPQVGNCPARDVGEQLITRRGAEGMQHAVVGTDVQRRHTVLVGGEKTFV